MSRPLGLPTPKQVRPGDNFQLVFVTSKVWKPDAGAYNNTDFVDASNSTAPPYGVYQSDYDKLVQGIWASTDLSATAIQNWLSDAPGPSGNSLNLLDFRAIVSTAAFAPLPCCPAPGYPSMPGFCTTPTPQACPNLDISASAYNPSDPSNAAWYPVGEASGNTTIWTLGSRDLSSTLVIWGTRSLFDIQASGSKSNLCNPIDHNECGKMYDLSGVTTWPVEPSGGGISDCSAVWTGSTNLGKGFTGDACTSIGAGFGDMLGFQGTAPGSTNPCFTQSKAFQRGSCLETDQGWIYPVAFDGLQPLIRLSGGTPWPASGARLYAISKILKMPGGAGVCPGPPTAPHANPAPSPPPWGDLSHIYLPRPLCLPTREQVEPGKTFQLVFVTSTLYDISGTCHDPGIPPYMTCHQDYDELVRTAWDGSYLKDVINDYLQQDISWNALVSTMDPVSCPSGGSCKPASNCRDWDNGYTSISGDSVPPTSSTNNSGVFTLGDCSCSTPCLPPLGDIHYSKCVAASSSSTSRSDWPLWKAHTGGGLENAISSDENGYPIAPTDPSFVWTGTDFTGLGAADHSLGWWPGFPAGAPGWGHGSCFEIGINWVDMGSVGLDDHAAQVGLRLYAISNVLTMPSDASCIFPWPPSSSPYFEDCLSQGLDRPHCLPSPTDVPEGETFQMIFVTSKTWSGPHCDISFGPIPFATEHSCYDLLVNDMWQQSDLSGIVERFLACGGTDGECFDPPPVPRSIKWTAIVSTNKTNMQCPGLSSCNACQNARDWICPMIGQNTRGIFTLGDCSLCSFASGTNPDCWCPYDASAAAWCNPPSSDTSRNDWNRPKRIFYGYHGGPFCPWDPNSGTPLHPINTDENGKLLDGSVDPSYVWTGTTENGHCDQWALGYTGHPNCYGSSLRWTIGEMDSSGSGHWIKSQQYATPGGIGSGVGLRLYAISELLIMPHAPPPPPPPPPPNPAIKAPIVKKRVGVCEPLCGINLQSDNVVQPQPPNESAKMRGAKRVRGRGWRRVSLNTYKEMKKGNLPLLGKCYHKYRK